jgi:GT2 family glycosyltransferase
MTQPPLVSVSMVTHNHEQFIVDAIESVIRQTFTDWELVVVNDGSTDATSNRMRDFDDPRIVCIDQDNQGPGAATNRAIATSRGTYVALMSGDDVCCPDRLEAQLRTYVSGSRRVLFGEVGFIDAQGASIESEHFASSLFETEERTRAQMFHRLFEHGNFLNGVTVFTEREVFLEAGPYDPSLFQLQDFDLWVRLIKKYDLCVVPGRVTKYRIHRDNLSGQSTTGSVRSTSELYLVMRTFFDDAPAELFHEAFDHQLIHPDCNGCVELQCEQAFLYLKSSFKLNQLIGVERLHELLVNPDSAEILERRYSVTPLSFASMLTGVDVMNLSGRLLSSVYVDTGSGFNEKERVQAFAHIEVREFSVRFDLRRIGPFRSLRWDPLEGYWCAVRITKAWSGAPDGRSVVIDLTTVHSNGTARKDGTVVFETVDPMFFLPISGDLADLTIQGEWEVTDMPRLIADLRRQEAGARQQADRAEEHEAEVQRQLERARRELETVVSERELQLSSKQGELNAKQAELNLKQAELDSVFRSRTWRLTAPYRRVRSKLTR